MGDESKKKSGGCLGKLVFLFLLACSVGLAACLYCIFQPQDLGDIGGRFPEPGGRDLTAVLKQSASRNIKVTIQEKELNQWLQRRVKGVQTGPLAAQVNFERVWVRLREGLAEVVMERTLGGRSFTVSMYLQVSQTEGPDGVKSELQLHGGRYHELMTRPEKGGRFGTLVVPQGFLLLVLPAYKNLAAALKEEIQLGFHGMSRIAIKDGRLELDPSGPQTTF